MSRRLLILRGAVIVVMLGTGLGAIVVCFVSPPVAVALAVTSIAMEFAARSLERRAGERRAQLRTAAELAAAADRWEAARDRARRSRRG